MKHWITIPRIFLILFILLISFSGFTLHKYIADNWPAFISLFLAVLLTLFKLLYDSFSLVYLWVNKFLAITLNRTNRWELEIQYFLKGYDIKVLDKAVEIIKKQYKEASLWQSTELQKIIKTQRFVSRLRISQAVEELNLENSLSVEISEMTVPYRATEKILKKELTPFIELLSRGLDVADVKYVFRIRYEDENPFFGIYVRKLPPNHIAKFNCELFELIGGESESVTIQKESTVIITSTITGLQTLSEKYLLLSSS